jgi:aspartate 1-decarboxylase
MAVAPVWVRRPSLPDSGLEGFFHVLPPFSAASRLPGKITAWRAQAMQRILLKAKIHRAKVTGACLDYEGSLSIDRTLMDLVDIALYEQVNVYNVNTGERFDTYAIPAPEGSGEICLNGAAARKGQPGDLVIIATYALLEEAEIATHQPRVVFVDGENRPKPKTR